MKPPDVIKSKALNQSRPPPVIIFMLELLYPGEGVMQKTGLITYKKTIINGPVTQFSFKMPEDGLGLSFGHLSQSHQAIP